MKTKLIAYLAMLPLLSFVHVISAEEVEEVVVTGSFIKGSPTDGASPVGFMTEIQLKELVLLTLQILQPIWLLILDLKIMPTLSLLALCKEEQT